MCPAVSLRVIQCGRCKQIEENCLSKIEAEASTILQQCEANIQVERTRLDIAAFLRALLLCCFLHRLKPSSGH
jgi:hypothetical protein